MTHLSPELLAGVALESVEILDPADRSHVESCPTCRAEVASFSSAADILRSADRTPAPTPAPRLWERIAADLSSEAPTSAVGPVGSVGPVEPDAPTASVTPVRPRPRWALGLLAAAVGLVVGIGGTILVDRALSRSDVVASTALVALPGHSGSGSAQLLRHDGVTELRVRVQASPPEQDYRELWLLNTDGERMYSLGVLPVSGVGTYPVPPQLSGDLAGFTIVDVSLEPYDGQVGHSANSLVRGALPV